QPTKRSVEPFPGTFTSCIQEARCFGGRWKVLPSEYIPHRSVGSPFGTFRVRHSRPRRVRTRPTMSTPRGQDALHSAHVMHFQRNASVSPNWASRTSWRTRSGVFSARGHAAVHVPHWKHRFALVVAARASQASSSNRTGAGFSERWAMATTLARPRNRRRRRRRDVLP